MFLDDKIIAIAKNVQFDNSQSIENAKNKMLNVCLNYVKEMSFINSSTEFIGTALKRANAQFKRAVIILDKKYNKTIIKENDFADLYLNNKKFTVKQKNLLRKYLK